MADTHLLNAIKYVEQNPVKAFMVKYPWDYKYTSCLKRLNLVKEDILLSSHSLINSIENYKEFLEEDNKIDLIKEKTRTSKPCGDVEFYNKIKEITGIDYTNKKAGRPKKND
ncbi:hypothetical protein KO488_10415 [Poseidonibacter lekithochrous]|uniref:hypothetical protein n=1 Tax=Poseidonibacter TaxID=2321187 RepID=UPI001C08EFB8|nr:MULTISPECIES: hypothetical protein [Poseidonibacter]MBU3015172.1 hypothetical protein [Poseidonibacter lekithochrous]MDO6828469.1 hypothetical protein [Poseidonibacter sp. 1_MG-2023]